MDDIKLFAKKGKRSGDTDTSKKNIPPEYRKGIWHEKCAMLKMKRVKRNRRNDRITKTKNIWMQGEKENYSYLVYWKRTQSNKRR